MEALLLVHQAAHCVFAITAYVGLTIFVIVSTATMISVFRNA